MKNRSHNFSLEFKRYSTLQRSLISAVLALLAYGAWGYVMNSMHGVQVALKAAIVQGVYSFVLTMLMTLLIEEMYRIVTKYMSLVGLVNTLTIVISCSIVYSTSWWINYIAGTPEIFDTVILGYIFGGIFTFTYVLGLSKDRIQNISN